MERSHTPGNPPPRACTPQAVPETTRTTNPLPPLCGVACFGDRVPVVSLRSTTGYNLCSLREHSPHPLRPASHSGIGVSRPPSPKRTTAPARRMALGCEGRSAGMESVDPRIFRAEHRLLTATGLFHLRRSAVLHLPHHALADAEGISESSRGWSAATPPEGRPPGTAPRQGVSETTQGTNPLPPLRGVACFLDRAPGVEHIDNRGEQLRAAPPAALEICGAKVPPLRGFSQKRRRRRSAGSAKRSAGTSLAVSPAPD